jgi:CobQ-like glutamine amidotransferase family enzyme
MTVAGEQRLVGPALGVLDHDVVATECLLRPTVVGFENHAGRTTLGTGARPLAQLELGAGNNAEDGTEGLIALPGERGIGGLRIGTYFHGPLLPRNPHVADLLLRHALSATGQPVDLRPLDDRLEWNAHDSYIARARRSAGTSESRRAQPPKIGVQSALGRCLGYIARHGPQ